MLTEFFISIHAAREGGDNTVRRLTPAFFAFQSTPPVKAATATAEAVAQRGKISIHAAREGGDVLRWVFDVVFGRISIHAAREGGD